MELVRTDLHAPPPPSRGKRVLRRVLPHLGLLVILGVFAYFGVGLLPGYRYQMNPDGVSYLTIARQYLQGHYADAVNAYWSPLYSWMLVPLLAMGIVGPLATKILALFIGGGILCAMWWLLCNLRAAVELRVIACLTLIPILFQAGMTLITPDLLMAGTMLLYLAHFTTPKFFERWYHGPVAGLLGGVAYLSKAYALPVVLVHFTLVNAIHFLAARQADAATGRPTRGRVLMSALLGYLAFAIVAGTWAGMLTHKYGYVTLGSTGRFNVAWDGPKFIAPMSNGFLLPPNPTGTSGWDDATVTTYPTWNPLGTPEEQKYWEANRARNEGLIISDSRKFTWLLWFVLLAGIRLSASKLDPAPRWPGMIVIIAMLIYPLGYYLLHVEPRFMTLVGCLLMATGVFAITALTSPMNRWVRVPLRTVAAILLAWSFLSNPEYDPNKQNWPMALGRWSIAKEWSSTDEISSNADALRGLIPPRARVASVGNWRRTLFEAYLLDLHYFGEAKPGATPAQIEAELKQMGVEYLWVWGGTGRVPFVRQLPEISKGKIPGLGIYSLNPGKETSPSTVPSTTEPVHP